MGNAGGTKHVPIDVVNGVLVTHHQCRNQTCNLAYFDMGVDAIPHALPRQRDRVGPVLPQSLRLGVGTARAYVSCALHATLPQPKFVVKTIGIAAAMGRLDAHGHAPELPRTHVTGLALQGH